MSSSSSSNNNNNNQPTTNTNKTGEIELEEIITKDGKGERNKGKRTDKSIFTTPAMSIAAFLFASAQGDISLVEHLLDEESVKVDDCDYDKRTALHVASAEGHIDIVRLLLREGANVNFADRYNSTALDDAIHHGHTDVSKLLLENGGKHGQGTNFALDLVQAAGNGDLKTVEKLVENGISVQSADYDLRTPLHVAIAGRYESVVQFLLDKGADLNVEDRFGGTPLEEAHRAGVRLGEDPMLELINKYTKVSEYHSWKSSFTNPFFLTFLFLECLIGVLYAIFSVYGPGASAGGEISDGFEDVIEKYPFYMDVHVMIFIGFGYLMTFLRKHGYTAVGLTFIIGALSIQTYLLCSTFWGDILANSWQQVEINVVQLIKADFAAGAVLISFGALLGKITFTQMLLLAVLEVFFYALNEAVCNKLYVADVGGSMVIHVFGAFFGLSASYALTSVKAKGNKDNSAVYHSDLFSMVGTIFLWMYWPSFNAALAYGNSQQRAVVNTVLSLTASCVFAFMFSQFWRRTRHFNMVDIQNATLAGGVAMGSAADMVLHPAFALLIGAIAGLISVLGFSKIQDRGDRSAARQGQIQLAFLCITLGMAIIPGYFCGKVLSGCSFPKKFFMDSESWETPSHIRGEAKHSNEKPDASGAGGSYGSIDDKAIEKMVTAIESKINALEDTIRDQKKTLRQQAKQLQGLTGSSANFTSSSALLSKAPELQQSSLEISLASMLEALTSKVNYLVDKSKKDE